MEVFTSQASAASEVPRYTDTSGKGAGSGLGAVVFRYLIYFFTWAATGHSQFGQQGRVPSAHLPWLGLGFFVVIPVIGGLLYGPLIYRFAREARGHGVPEVMIAVADNGGRIRPQVSAVKAVASALCIGVGTSSAGLRLGDGQADPREGRSWLPRRCTVGSYCSVRSVLMAASSPSRSSAHGPQARRCAATSGCRRSAPRGSATAISA